MKRILNHLRSDWYKYLLELIVITAGVIGAFALNNWNEGRKEDKLEQDYYCRLLEDVNQDEYRLELHQEVTKNRLKASNLMLGLLQKENPSSHHVFAAMLEAMGGSNYAYAPTTSAFEDIKSSGNLNILSDLELKNQLTTYYTDSKRLLDNVSGNSQAMDHFLFRKDNFIQLGGTELAIISNGLDSTMVDMSEFKEIQYSKETIAELKDLGMWFTALSSRNLHHFSLLEIEIQKIKKVLSEKCQ